MEQLCTFDVGRLFVGIEIARIQEILRWQPLTPVPLAPGIVRGLMSLRGQIVPVLDLRQRLELQPHDEVSRDSFNVLIRTPDGAVSLLVDRVGDVVEVSQDCFEQVPETLPSHLRPLIRGAYKLERRLLLSLDATIAAHLEL